MGEKLREIWDNVWKAIREIGSKAWDAIKEFFTTTDWGAIGKAILDGIAAGITNGVQAIKDAATNAAKAALDAAKGFLGIESPSKEFAKLGNFMMQGMAIGINSQSRLPVRAAVNAAGETTRAVYNTFNLTAQYGNQSPTSLAADVQMLAMLYGG